MQNMVIDLVKLEKSIGKNIKLHFYHPDNNDLKKLYELITFGSICRKCKEAACIAACPKEALERDQDGKNVRHNMRCVKCNSCALACPFGTTG